MLSCRRCQRSEDLGLDELTDALGCGSFDSIDVTNSNAVNNPSADVFLERLGEHAKSLKEVVATCVLGGLKR